MGEICGQFLVSSLKKNIPSVYMHALVVIAKNEIIIVGMVMRL